MSEFFTFNVGTRLTFTGLKASWNDVISVNPQLSEVNLNSKALTTTVSIKLRPSKRVQINTVLSCLLYTSPSPRDRQKSRMPSSA